MKAQELRIGNLLSYDGNVVQVSNIGSNGFETTKDGILYGSSDLSAYDPIPLTEQWLIHLGFGKVQNIYQRHNQILLDPESNGSYKMKFWTHSISRAEPLYQSNLAIRYVHQLQNLYFALTGEDLQL